MLRPRSCCDAHWLQNDQTVLKNYKSPRLSLLQTQFHKITFHHVDHVTLMCLVVVITCNYYLEVHITIRLWEDWNGRSWILAQLVNLVMLAVTFLVHSSHGPFMERTGRCLKETQVPLVKFEAWEASRYFMILKFQISNFNLQGLALQKQVSRICEAVASGCQWRLASWLCRLCMERMYNQEPLQEFRTLLLHSLDQQGHERLMQTGNMVLTYTMTMWHDIALRILL